MAYDSKARKEDPNAEARSVAPATPKTERVVRPQVTGTKGGAPKLKGGAIRPQRGSWVGKSRTTGSAGTMPVPSMLTLPQTQEQIGNFVGEVKTRFDLALKERPDLATRNPRFWRAYQEYPEGVATMLARRAYTDQIVGAGPVADYMRFLEGLGK